MTERGIIYLFTILYGLLTNKFILSSYLFQWVYFVTGPSSQQGTCFQWDRERCSLFARPFATSTHESGASGSFDPCLCYLQLKRIEILLTSVTTLFIQEKRLMHNLRQYKVPLQRYVAMMDLQVLFAYHDYLYRGAIFCVEQKIFLCIPKKQKLMLLNISTVKTIVLLCR